MTFALIALLDADAQQAGGARAWRDQVLLPAVSALPGAGMSHIYGAFNANQLALVTQLGDTAPTMQAPPAPPPRVSLRLDLAELTYEKLQPGTRDPLDVGILYSVRFKVPPDWADEFDRWYEEEHLEMIYGSRQWSMSRRYRIVESAPGGDTHLALHYLSDARGLDAPQAKAARITPWRNRLVTQRWFTDVEKMIYFGQTLEGPAR